MPPEWIDIPDFVNWITPIPTELDWSVWDTFVNHFNQLLNETYVWVTNASFPNVAYYNDEFYHLTLLTETEIGIVVPTPFWQTIPNMANLHYDEATNKLTFQRRAVDTAYSLTDGYRNLLEAFWEDGPLPEIEPQQVQANQLADNIIYRAGGTFKYRWQKPDGTTQQVAPYLGCVRFASKWFKGWQYWTGTAWEWVDNTLHLTLRVRKKQVERYDSATQKWWPVLLPDHAGKLYALTDLDGLYQPMQAPAMDYFVPEGFVIANDANTALFVRRAGAWQLLHTL